MDALMRVILRAVHADPVATIPQIARAVGSHQTTVSVVLHAAREGGAFELQRDPMTGLPARILSQPVLCELGLGANESPAAIAASPAGGDCDNTGSDGPGTSPLALDAVAVQSPAGRSSDAPTSEACGAWDVSIRPDDRMYPTETDPIWRGQHEPGAKLDAGKNRLGLVLMGFARALQEVGKVGTYGANKYTDNGWVEVPDGERRYTDAMLRHLLAEAGGEDVDADSGLLHAAHLAWNALARLDLMIRAAESTALEARQ